MSDLLLVQVPKVEVLTVGEQGPPGPQGIQGPTGPQPPLGTATPAMDGAATAGTAPSASHEDHVHPTDTSRAAASHTHAESDVTGLATDLAAKEPGLGLPSVSGQVLSSTTGGVRSWITAGGGLTYWAEAQSTAAPNATVPVSSLAAAGAAANIDVALVPKGEGAILAQVPTSTAAGGNKRGLRAIDLQTYRSAANRVASGNYSLVIGESNLASGAISVAIGSNNYASGSNSICLGANASATNWFSTVLGGSYGSATGQYATVVGGANNNATQTYAACLGGHGNYAQAQDAVTVGGSGNKADGYYSVAFGSLANTYSIMNLAAHGSSTCGQGAKWVCSIVTTGATTTRLTADASGSTAGSNLVLTNYSAIAFTGLVSARQRGSDGTASAAWKIEGLIRREGTAASTTLVAMTVTPISNAPGWTLAVSADTTIGALALDVTGAAATNVAWAGYLEMAMTVYP